MDFSLSVGARAGLRGAKLGSLSTVRIAPKDQPWKGEATGAVLI